MEFSKLITKRYSVRAYKPDPVPDEILNKVLEAARLAPTAANRQPFQLIVIHTRGREAETKQGRSVPHSSGGFLTVAQDAGGVGRAEVAGDGRHVAFVGHRAQLLQGLCLTSVAPDDRMMSIKYHNRLTINPRRQGCSLTGNESWLTWRTCGSGPAPNW
jgi:hypothetical protein